MALSRQQLTENGVHELTIEFHLNAVVGLYIQGLWVDLMQLNRTFSKHPDEVTPEDVSNFASDSSLSQKIFRYIPEPLVIERKML